MTTLPDHALRGERLPVMEIFGPTIQGEGVNIGEKTGFIRFAGCDLRCEWCDTKEAWDVSAASWMTVAGIAEQVKGMGVTTISLTGGNPLLFDLEGLVSYLKNWMGCFVNVETQGTRYQEWVSLVDLLTVCPKRGHYDKGIVSHLLLSAQDCQLKVVVFDEDDYAFAKAVHRDHPFSSFTFQAGSVDGQPTNLQWLAERVAADRDLDCVRVLPQLHCMIWGNRKGV